MFRIDTTTDTVYFPDGFTLAPPYEDARYLEYAAWVQEGNSPELFQSNNLVGEMDIVVKAAQAKKALYRAGYYEKVLLIMKDPSTPEEIKIDWEYQTEFRRNDPTVLLLAKILQLTKVQLDQLFELAASLV